MITRTAMPAEDGPDLLPEVAAAADALGEEEAAATVGCAVMAELEVAGVVVVGARVGVVVGVADVVGRDEVEVGEVGEVGEEVERRSASLPRSSASLRAVSVVDGKWMMVGLAKAVAAALADAEARI